MCGLTDSIAASLAGRREEVTAFDRLSLGMSAAFCRKDFERGYRLALEQAELRPRSTYAVYSAGFFALASGRWRKARELLARIDPDRDLGWMPDPGKAIYWRDYTAAEHFLGDYRAELRLAERELRDHPDRIAARMHVARALAGLSRGREALAHVDFAVRLPHDAAVRMVGGLSGGVMAYLTAAELLVHGDTAAPDGLPNVPRSGTRVIRRIGSAGAWDARLTRITNPAIRAIVGTQRTRIALALGERGRALELLEAAAKLGVVRVLLGSDMHTDLLYDPLRGDPRFERINRAEG